MRNWLLGILLFTFFGNAGAAIVTINFDDGTGNGNAIDSFYSDLGVTFTNAEWNDGLDGRPGATSPFQIASISDGTLTKSGDPIVAVFDGLVDMVSISGIDVGFNDTRIDAYDAVVGGNLIGFDEYEGATALGNEGDANDTAILTIAIAGIKRIELYQPSSVQFNDGTTWDNLEYSISAVPVPAAVWLFGSFLLGLAGYSRQRKSA